MLCKLNTAQIILITLKRKYFVQYMYLKETNVSYLFIGVYNKLERRYDILVTQLLMVFKHKHDTSLVYI